MNSSPFFLMAGLYLLLDALAVAALALETAGILPPVPGLSWTRVHLLTIGVVTQVIAGTLPGLVAQKLGGSLPSVRTTWSIWLLINGSFAVLLTSMPAGRGIVAAAGATGIFAGIVLLLATIHRQRACPPVGSRYGLRFFIAGPMFFLVGILMALSMLLVWPSPGGYSGLFEAHVHANVWGFVALVVAGALLDWVPALVNRPLRLPNAVPLTSWLLIAGAAGLVAGPWFAVMPMTMIGLVIYVAGTVLLLANLIGTAVAARVLTPNLTHLLIAYVWLIVPAFVAPIVLATTGKLPAGPVEQAAAMGLVAGWILQVVIGAFPALIREAQPVPTQSEGRWFSVVALNLGVLAIWAAAFADSATWVALNVAGDALIIAAWLPLLADIVSRLVTVTPTATPA